MDVAVYNERIMGPTHVENVADLACRTALGLSRRGAHHLSRRPPGAGSQTSSARSATCRITPPTCTRAARGCPTARSAARRRILNAGKKVAILAGPGALDAADELEQVAERLGAPIVKALLGKAACRTTARTPPAASACSGTEPSQEAMEDCDTLLMVGTSFPYIEFMPKPGQARGVQIELDPKRIGLRYPVEVGLVGDSRNALRELIAAARSARRIAAFSKAAQEA